MGKIWIFFVCLALLLKGGTSVSRIEPRLAKVLQREGTADVVVTMRSSTSSVLKASDGKAFATRGQRITSMVTELEELAATSQVNVITFLEDKITRAYNPFSYRSFWISNQIFIRGASQDLVKKLGAFNEIQTIAETPVVGLSSGWTSEKPATLDAAKEQTKWNIARIQAPQVWDKEKNTGKGIVVATIDTGVRGTHEALRNNYRQNYGWFDYHEKTREPSDKSGRGTHVMGTIAGSGTGVAPGSQWISCKACSHYWCKIEAIVGCAQWILCPTDSAGGNKNCSMAPNVVSNSWGIPGGDGFFQGIIQKWSAANIIPIFNAGWYEEDLSEETKPCGTLISPGDYINVLAVGATNSSDLLTKWSSVGPSPFTGQFKPDVVAPGADICSASFTSDTAYWCSESDSWTAPHLAGTVALMLASRPGDKPCFEKVRRALRFSSGPIQAQSHTCSKVKDNEWPNWHHGYGLINALEAVRFYKSMTSSCPY